MDHLVQSPSKRLVFGHWGDLTQPKTPFEGLCRLAKIRRATRKNCYKVIWPRATDVTWNRRATSRNLAALDYVWRLFQRSISWHWSTQCTPSCVSWWAGFDRQCKLGLMNLPGISGVESRQQTFWQNSLKLRASLRGLVRISNHGSYCGPRPLSDGVQHSVARL